MRQCQNDKPKANQRDGSFGLCIAFAENHHVLILGRVSYLLHLSQRCFLSFARLLLFREVLKKCKIIINKIITWIDVNNTKYNHHVKAVPPPPLQVIKQYTNQRDGSFGLWKDGGVLYIQQVVTKRTVPLVTFLRFYLREKGVF